MTTREQQKKKMELMQQGMRLMNGGLSREFGAPPKRGWIAGGNDLRQPIKPDKLIEACDRFRGALAVGPDLTALNLLGLMQESLGRYGEAEKTFRELGVLAEHQQSRPYADGARQGAERCARKARDPAWKIPAGNVAPASDTAAVDQAEKHATEFAAALIAGRFTDAHGMLSRAARKQWPVSKIEDAYKRMTAGIESSLDHVGVLDVMEDWPDKGPADMAWLCISLEGPGGGEAVTVEVQLEEGRPVIRKINWGRP